MVGGAEDRHTGDDECERNDFCPTEGLTENCCADDRYRGGADPGPDGVADGDRHVVLDRSAQKHVRENVEGDSGEELGAAGMVG